MTKTNKNQSGVRGCVSLAKKVNSEIGSYVEHFITTNFNYRVKLSNGALTVPTEAAQDYEAQPSTVTPDRVKLIADSFDNSNP